MAGAFNPIGMIKLERKVTRRSWSAVVKEQAGLTLRDSCELVDLAGKPSRFRSPKDFARLVLGGKQVGGFFRQGERVIVFGDEKRVVPVAKSIATELGGRFVTLEELVRAEQER
jgi:hypothetical protein